MAHQRIDGIPRRTRHIADNQTCFSQKGIDKGGLADIGAAHNRDLGDLDGACVFRPRRHQRIKGVQQFCHARAMLRRDGIDLFDTQRIKVSDQRLGFWGVDFVGGRKHRLAGLSQEIHDFPIHRCQPVPSIQDENQRIRLFDGEPGLLANQPVHKVR